MKRGVPVNELLLRRRRRIARRVIAAGGNVTDFAAAIGVSVAGASLYLGKRAPDLLSALRWARRAKHWPSVEECLRRLIAVRDGLAAGKTYRRIAADLGMKPPALGMWLARFAPDSVEQAIEDLQPEPVEPETEELEAA
jgi:hypothetical protein